MHIMYAILPTRFTSDVSVRIHRHNGMISNCALSNIPTHGKIKDTCNSNYTHTHIHACECISECNTTQNSIERELSEIFGHARPGLEAVFIGQILLHL